MEKLIITASYKNKGCAVEITDEITAEFLELMIDNFYSVISKQFPKNCKSYDDFKKDLLVFWKGKNPDLNNIPKFESSITKKDIKIKFRVK